MLYTLVQIRENKKVSMIYIPLLHIDVDILKRAFFQVCTQLYGTWPAPCGSRVEKIEMFPIALPETFTQVRG
jgi:hypothetical protein